MSNVLSAISLKAQSLRETAPSAHDQLRHHISLLGSKTSTQRHDSLAHLTALLSASNSANDSSFNSHDLFSKAVPLILDGSLSVRTSLLKLFRILPVDAISMHAEKLSLHIRAGMTHLSHDIRLSALDVLSWFLQTIPGDAVECPGGWVKTLKCFTAMLGWEWDRIGGTSNWTSVKGSLGKTGKEGRVVVHAIIVLGEFLRAGLVEVEEEMEDHSFDPGLQVLYGRQSHQIPRKPNAYAYLNLFGAARDAEGEMYPWVEQRQRVFHELGFCRVMERELNEAKKEGGDVGRAASGALKALSEGVNGYENEGEEDTHPTHGSHAKNH